MGQGKACANERVVIEIIVALGEIILDELAQCLRRRVLNHISEDTDEVRDQYSVSLILKKIAPASPGHLRPIAVLPCLLNLFFAARTFLISPSVTLLS